MTGARLKSINKEQALIKAQIALNAGKSTASATSAAVSGTQTGTTADRITAFAALSSKKKTSASFVQGENDVEGGP